MCGSVFPVSHRYVSDGMPELQNQDIHDTSLIYEVGAFHAMPLHQSGSHGFRFLQDQALHPGSQVQSVRLTL